MSIWKGIALPAVAAALLAATATGPAVADASPLVEIKGNPPSKQWIPFPHICTGPSWIGPCEFTVAVEANVFDEDGIKSVEAFVDTFAVVEVNVPLPGCAGGGPQNVTSTVTHTFNPDVLCGTSEWHEIRFDAEDCTDLTQSDWQWILLICDPCDPAFPQASAHSNGTTFVEPSPDDTSTAVQFVVTNRSGELRTVDLGLLMTEPWTVELPPPSVDLPPGGSESFLLAVFVPGGLPEGTLNELTFTAVFQDDPASATAAAAQVVVSPTNAFRDFSVDEVQIVPSTGTSYDVNVDVSVRPWMPWTGAIPLKLVLPDGTDGPSTGLIAFGQQSETCCDDAGDCPAIPGYTATCGPPSCIDPEQVGDHVCSYHKTVSFTGLYLPAGGTLTAVLDPVGLLPEIDPGSDANNALSAVVPLPNVNRLINAVTVVPGSGPGLHDIQATAGLEAFLDENPLDLSAQYQAFVNGDPVGESTERNIVPGGGGSSCYFSLPPCSGECPTMDWGGGEDIGACGTGGAGTCTCKYDHVKLLAADVPLLPGDEITVCLTSLPGAEPEAYVADDCKLAVYCPGDLDGDGIVGIVDFLTLLANWGPCV